MAYSIPSRYTKAIDSKIRGDIISAIEKLTDPENDKDGIYIFGPTGTGKSFIAHQIGCEFEKIENRKEYQSTEERKNNEPILYQATELLVKTKHYMKKGDISFFDSIKKREGLLILDDFGSNKANDFTSDLLFLLVDYRYSYQLPTIFTSNFSFKDLSANNYDERMIDRIIEMCTMIEIDGKDKRRIVNTI